MKEAKLRWLTPGCVQLKLKANGSVFLNQEFIVDGAGLPDDFVLYDEENDIIQNATFALC